MTLSLVIGYGAVGRAVVKALVARGDTVAVAQRTRPKDLPDGVAFRACDVEQADSVRRAVQGARQVVLAVGFAYDRKVWRRLWTPTMTNVVDACSALQARLVFIDNLYQLGPQTRPRDEAMPLSRRGAKPAILSQVTDIWTAAASEGRLRVAALRCTDFYGPDTPVSHLGSTGLGALAKGKPALLLAPPDTPHDFAYVPDIARAVLNLLDAGDEAYGQVWNMPCAPTLTPRQILRLGARAISAKPSVIAIPLGLLPILGVFSSFMKEVWDIAFTWDRPYIVDGSKFSTYFDFEPTPFEVGAPATALWFKTHPT